MTRNRISTLGALALGASFIAAPLWAAPPGVFIDGVRGEAQGPLAGTTVGESIGCALITARDPLSGQFSQSIQCSATDGLGTTLACVSHEPVLVQMVRLLRGRGRLFFSVDPTASGNATVPNCTALEVSVGAVAKGESP